MEKTLFSAAVQNPMLATSMFESATGISTGSSQSYQPPNQCVLQGVSQDQLDKMKKLASYIRLAMIGVATLMMATCYYNFGTTTSTTSTTSTTATTGTTSAASYATSSTFIALYLLFFSTMICCYEVGWSAITSHLVQNFGFLYFPISRFIFLILVSILLFSLSTFGKVIFAFLWLVMLAELYVGCAFPKYEKFIRLTHMNMMPLPDSGQGSLQMV